MENMVSFAIERHWNCHVGMPTFTEIGNITTPDGTGRVHHFECGACHQCVEVTEPLNVDELRRDDE